MPEFSLDAMIKFIADPKSIQQVNQTVSGLKSMIGKALGAIGIGFSLKALNDAVEQVRSINLSLESAVGQFGDMDEIQKKVLDTSKDVLGNYEDIAKNVSDLVKNNKTLFDLDNATRFTDVMTKLTKLSGGSNSDASGLISGMASAMKTGKIDSGTIENLFQKAPEAIKILTDYYGVSERKLRTMAQAGILKAKDIQKAFLDAGESVDKAFSGMAPKVSDVLASARSQFKYFIQETDEMLGITKTVAKFLQSGFQVIMSGLQKARSGVIFLTQKLGGMENTLKILAVVAASFISAMGIAKIASKFDKVADGAKGLTKIFSTLGIKGTLIVAAIALIILAVDDFIHFMKGNKSLLGVLFQKAGIDADEARAKIVAAWGKIKAFLVATWGVIKKVGTAVWGELTAFWDKNGARILEVCTKYFKAVVTIIKKVVESILFWWNHMGSSLKDVITKTWAVIKSVFQFYLDSFMDAIAILCDIINGDWSALWEDVKKLFVNAWNNMVDYAKKLWDLLVSIFGAIVQAIIMDFEWIGKQIAPLWNSMCDGIVKAAQATWNWLVGLWGKIKAFFVKVGQAIVAFFVGIWNKIKEIGKSIADFFVGIWNSITETVGRIKDSVVEGFQKAIDWITELPGKALQWGKDIIQKIIDGILGKATELKETFEGIFEDPVGFIKDIPGKAVEWGKDIAGEISNGIQKGAGAVKNAASWVAKGVSSVLHFSEPDEGPLSNFHTYMPDMIAMIVNGIKQGVPKVENVMVSLTNSMRDTFASGFNGVNRAGALGIFDNLSEIKEAVKKLNLAGIAEKVKLMSGEAIISPRMLNGLMGNNNVSRSVVQNVEITNTFNGDRAGQQKASVAMKGAAKDATAQMGRALLFAR